MESDVFEKYNNVGVNPLELACGCAVKVDLYDVVYPAIGELRNKFRGSGLEFSPRNDAEIVRAKEIIEIHRRIYALGDKANVDPEDVRRIDPVTCVALFQVFQQYANDHSRFMKLVEPVYSGIVESGVRFRFGKGHSIITTSPYESIAIFDFISLKGRDLDKFLVVNNDTINIIDPTAGIDDRRQVIGAICNALNDLFVLGVCDEIQIAPLIGFSESDVRKNILEHAKEFIKENNFRLLEVPQYNSSRLFLGATVLGTSEKQPPVRGEFVEAGMKVIVTRSFGELSPITVYVSSIINDEIRSEVERFGISLDELKKEKDRAVGLISSPNLKAAKVINKYLPKIGERFKEEHIPLASDISGPGIYIFAEMAEKANASIEIDEIPLLSPEISEYANRTFLMTNSTAGTNGAFCLITPDSICDDVIDDLKKVGYSPHIIGSVKGKGEAKVKMPKELLKYVRNINHPILEVND